MPADDGSKRADSDNSDNSDNSDSNTGIESLTSLTSSPYFVSLAGQLGLGGITGYSVGYATKEIGKKVLFWGGTIVIGLQFLAYKKIITMHWGNLFSTLTESLDQDGDGKFTGQDAQLWFQKFTKIVSNGVPGSASFLTGMYLALRS